MSRPAALTRDKVMFLATGLTGAFLVNLSAQFPFATIVDIQRGLSSTPDEASWILTVYTMASFAGIVTSVLFIKVLSIGRYMAGSSILFAITAFACALAPDLQVMIALRIVQGFAAGGFGPAAFVAVFMVAGGPRLPSAVTILAFLLLFPGALGPVIAGFVGESLGWQALFLVQAAIGAVLALAARAWVPHQAPNWSALKADWAGVFLLSLALASLTLVFSQGPRRSWLESDLIVWGTVVSVTAGAGFAIATRVSSLPIMAPRLLLTRRFGIPIGLNLVLRASLAVSSYLVPQFLAIVRGYRPLGVAELMLWPAAAQLLALPLVWWLMRLLDLRAVMAIGLVFAAFGAGLMVDETARSAADQFRLALVVYSVGQLLFLAPAMVVGTAILKPADLPTASLVFNISTLGGATLGVGAVSGFVAERQKFYSNVLTEHGSPFHALDADRITSLAGAFAGQVTDDAGASAQATALIASVARPEAWVLAFNDACIVIAVALTLSIVAVLAIGRSSKLPRLHGQPASR